MRKILIILSVFFLLLTLGMVFPSLTSAAECTIPFGRVIGQPFTVVCTGLDPDIEYKLLVNTAANCPGSQISTYPKKSDETGVVSIAVPTGEFLLSRPELWIKLYKRDPLKEACPSWNDSHIAGILPSIGLPKPPPYKPQYCNGDEKIVSSAIGCIPTEGPSFGNFFLKYFLGVAGVIAFFLIIVAGFQILTSAGDPEKLQGAKQLLTAAIVGLLFVVFAVVILQVMGYSILGGLPGFPRFVP